jgi:hypothetical protein
VLGILRPRCIGASQREPGGANDALEKSNPACGARDRRNRQQNMAGARGRLDLDHDPRCGADVSDDMVVIEGEFILVCGSADPCNTHMDSIVNGTDAEVFKIHLRRVAGGAGAAAIGVGHARFCTGRYFM